MKKPKIVLSIGMIMASFLLITFSVYNSSFTDKGKVTREKEQDSQVAGGIETIQKAGYTILLKGSARPEKDEIAVENAVEIGLKEYEKTHHLDAKECKIEMVFLDGIVKKAGTWSGHIKLNDTDTYEFIVDGKTGNVDYTSTSK
ncbi:hypothetical protein [Anaerocolumna xylanovorans]|uniref:Uncharacterized protein n=1 Tax=Anaerocolumna xylanovorans DSM 12503 TaxID=1121345 RepID=A0A1M7Y0G0_9FIRM|nr:hypothetical protein [Anaerocolumna xylanovorans]SHO45097.1 hypothetical protein SAMN02745217_00823 [Anaerocolumna xylanovorans DSM 12503]